MIAPEPGCEHLIHGDLAVVEPDGRGEQVQPPGALAL
jgi:hypothetical protein